VDLHNISFPGLGLEFELRRYAFIVFGIKIYWYGIIITLAFLAAVVMALRSCKKYDLTADNILDLVLFAAPVAIIFSRLYYVVFNWGQFRNDLIAIFKIRDGGLAIYGAVIGALLVAWLYTRKKKISFLNLADFGIPYVAFGQGIGRWGNFINQEAFGEITDLPWRMNGDEINRYIQTKGADPSVYGVHPTFLYESLLDIAVFAFLLYWRKKRKAEGEVLFLYFILYGTGRALIEGLRTDSLMLGSLRVSQVLSVILVLAGLFLFLYRRAQKRKSEEETVVIGQSRYGALLMQMKAEEEAEKSAAGLSEATSDGIGTAAGNPSSTYADTGTGEETAGTVSEDDSSETIEKAESEEEKEDK